MNEVYVIAGGEWLRNNLNAIAAFMGTRTWDSIEKIALTLSVLAVAVMWVKRRTKNAKAFHDKCENFSFRASNETAVLITAFYSLHGDHLGYG